MDEFVNITLSKDNFDRYYVRYSIFSALSEKISTFSGSFLDVGCGKMPYRRYILKNSKIQEYTGLDIETAREYGGVQPDFTWDGVTMPFEDNAFDTVMATEVLEHCPDPEITLKEIYRVLKPGGVLFFTVPFLWPLHETPCDEYRYTPFSLERHIVNSGFNKENITIKATGGWHASMAQMLGLWACRAPIPPRKRRWLKWFVMPVYKYLLRKDKLYPVKFKERQMITGLYGVIKK